MIALEELLLFDFGREEDIARWQPINDVVMGGLSESAFLPSGHGTALFTGNVSLENFGGFASVRAELEFGDLSTYDGLTLRVRGDGKRYHLRVRTSPGSDGVAYEHRFDTRPGEWDTVQVPFSDMAPTFRGEPVPQAPPLQRDHVYSLGLLIADEQAGPFSLEVAWLKAYGG